MSRTARDTAKHSIRRTAALQRGASLLTSLIFLLLITLMAVSASWQGVAQERLAGGQRHSSVALAGADAAARIGERWLYTFYTRSNGEALVGSSGGESGVYVPIADRTGADIQSYFSGHAWTEALGTPVEALVYPFAGAGSSAILARAPVYLIEDLGTLLPAGTSSVREGGAAPGAGSEMRIYRITAKSKSLNDAPVRTVQSVFAGRPKA